MTIRNFVLNEIRKGANHPIPSIESNTPSLKADPAKNSKHTPVLAMEHLDW